MKENEVLGQLSDVEFATMMREFEIAGDWMSEQLTQKNRRNEPAAPKPAGHPFKYDTKKQETEQASADHSRSGSVPRS
ncbi:hypothetical protein [Pseudomonas syringae]|uniref:hypothetical protein n=1 Tax=Pseudomonas syringae TaxID=317 RepID=UPI00041F0532|nr:hypothetical protein [Pseudomonas syringae]